MHLSILMYYFTKSYISLNLISRNSLFYAGDENNLGIVVDRYVQVHIFEILSLRSVQCHLDISFSMNYTQVTVWYAFLG